MPVFRIFFTFIVLGINTFLHFVLYPIGNTLIAEQAGKQLENSNLSFYQSYLTTHAFSTFETGADVFCFLIIFLIWLKPIHRVWQKFDNVARMNSLFILGFLLLLSPNNAWAYYDQKDWPEPIMIMPDESFFWIPNSGANKDSQTKFDSEQYYRENKLAVKYYEIPHTQLTGSSYWKNYVIPAGRAIIVSRKPYSSIWTSDSGTGTSHKNQGFECQSKEGLTIRTNISIGAHIEEEDAPKYLYRFPVKSPAGDRTKPEIIFTSVYYASSLQEQMDEVIWGFISKTFCNKVSEYPLKEVNDKLSTIMNHTEIEAFKYMKERGITGDYLGLAGTLTFGTKVQDANDEAFQAETIKPYLDVLTTKAVQSALVKWNGALPALPAFVVAPESLFSKAGETIKNFIKETGGKTEAKQ